MASILIWIIALISIGGIIIRPFGLPEFIWVTGGSILLLMGKLLLLTEFLDGIAKGIDVYLFLVGMMLLAETAREEKLFDWLAALAVRRARGSSQLLFLLIYMVGVMVTAILSNDATAVVLTPAVIAATRFAHIRNPLPYLFICAFTANAASFLLPISNPANLVLYGDHMPTLLQWLRQFGLPSVSAITITYWMLRYSQRESMDQPVNSNIPLPVLTVGSKTAILGIIVTGIILLACSFLHLPLGLPAAITGVATSVVVIIKSRANAKTIFKGVSWSILPLVAGLFVIMEALTKTGLTHYLSLFLHDTIKHSESLAAYQSGVYTAISCNLINNLPAGLLAGDVLRSGPIPELIRKTMLIGIDLGPNFSVTGSLATILWLVALRRENISVSAWTFLKVGILVTLPSLLAAIAVAFL